MSDANNRSAVLGMRRGAALRCPNCGKGHLYNRYIKVRACEVCGNDNAKYPSDDAPPYFTILIVGHLFAAPLLLFPWIWRGNVVIVLATVLPLLLVVTLVLLPVVKGAVIGVQWSLEQPDTAERERGRIGAAGARNHLQTGRGSTGDPPFGRHANHSTVPSRYLATD